MSARSSLTSFQVAGPTLDMSEAVFAKILQVNVQNAFSLVKLVRPHMGRGGSIILVSSVGGHQPSPPLGLYGVSKAAMIALGRVLSIDLGPAGIRVNTICPGIVRTKMAAMFWKEGSESEQEQLAKERRSSSLQRYGDPADIAAVAAFLASDDSSYMTGESLVVNGGGMSRL